ncbi:hypothetical protein EFE20_06185, partial [Latilactobacillus curvatus]|nr:hypothetical protein [Latilactobacillus curvatus]
LKDGFVVNTILKEADLFCPNSVRINFTIYLIVLLVFYTLISQTRITLFNLQLLQIICWGINSNYVQTI